MESRHLRPYSPSRRSGHPGRNSTGLLDLHPSYESYGGPRSSRESIPGPRSSADRVGAVRSAQLSPRAEILPVRRNPNDYDVAPRLRAGTEALRRPVNIVPVSSSQYRPTISSAVERSPRYQVQGRPREDESFYMQPATSSRRDHHRAFSNEGPEYGRYLPIERDRARDRPERGGYMAVTEGSGRYQDAPQIRPPRDKDDRDFGYEYTDFKEQAYRDTAPRPRPRRGSDAGARERPLSITGLEDYVKKSPQPSREAGPPVSTRGFSKIDRNGSVRHEYRYPRDTDPSRGAYEDDDGAPAVKASRAPVALHQDGYSSNAEDRGHERRHRSRRAESIDRGLDGAPPPRHAKPEDVIRKDVEKPRRHERHRSESSEDHQRHQHQSKYHVDGSRDYRNPEGGRRERGEDLEREHRRKGRGEESEKEYGRRDRGDESERERRRQGRGDESRRDKDKDKHDRHVGEGVALGAVGAAAVAGMSAEGAKQRREKKSTDSRDAEGTGTREAPRISSPTEEQTDEERRERRRRRRKEREEREQQEALSRSRNEQPGASRELTGAFDGNGKPLASDRSAPEDQTRRSRHQRKSSRHAGDGESSSSDEDPRPRRVRIAEPGKPVPEAKPKGILRPPREKFPEDPAPIREGVAPLKDAGKKGVPPNARWTKIDRRLVNPEALDLGNERFEERSDYVIVLRVLSKEEIEAYAQKTMEIREERQIEAQRNHMLALEDKERGYDEDKEPPKRLDSHPYNEGSQDLPVRPRDYEQRGSATQQPAATGAGPGPSRGSQDSFDSARPDYYPSTSYERVPLPSIASTTAGLNPLSSPPPTQGKYPPPPRSLSSTTASLSSLNPPSTQSSQQYSPQPSQYGSQGGYPPPAQYSDYSQGSPSSYSKPPSQSKSQSQGQGQGDFSQTSYPYPPSQGTSSSQDSYPPPQHNAYQQGVGGNYPPAGYAPHATSPQPTQAPPVGGVQGGSHHGHSQGYDQGGLPLPPQTSRP